MNVRALAMALACVLGLFAASPACAQSLTWKFKSEHPNTVSVELYSDNRNRVWPGSGEVYSLNDYSTRTINISCIRGEKICYGAWVRNTQSSSWGAGYGGKSSCKRCCYECDGGVTPTLVLD
jgi:hypothetical protein